MGKINVLVTFHLAPELLDKIKTVSSEIEILYDPSLLGKPRYLNDQHGGIIQRTPEQENRLQKMMAEAEALFGYIPPGYQREIKKWLPKLKWNQSPSAGIGWGAKINGWTETDVIFTTSSGMHDTPLAEFCIMAMLMHVKNYFLMASEKEEKHWARTCATELKGKTLAVIGLGKVGREVARLARCFGVKVFGTKRRTQGVAPSSLNVEKLFEWNDLKPMLGEADFVVLICPETEETRGLIGRKELAEMKKGAVIINISRGSIIDEDALIDALLSGHLGGAVLDVFQTEPLPQDNPLWEMPRVIISPHSASTADTENEKLTEIFVDNLQRYMAKQSLRNVLDKKLLY